MIRNAKTGRFESEKTEMTDEQKNAICYKSKLLNKYFDNYDELKAEEDAYNKARETALKGKEEKRVKADKVKSAITARVEAEAAAAKEKREAYKAYLEACDVADKKVAEKKKIEAEELRKFCEEYGAFHDTITIGDATYNVNYSVSSNTLSNLDPFERLFSLWF